MSPRAQSGKPRSAEVELTIKFVPVDEASLEDMDAALVRLALANLRSLQIPAQPTCGSRTHRRSKHGAA